MMYKQVKQKNCQPKKKATIALNTGETYKK